MKNNNTIKVNFRGGIIKPEELYSVLLIARKAGLLYVRFGLRQQLYFDVDIEEIDMVSAELELLGIPYEINKDQYPNIVSSFPAEDIFIINTWLNEQQYIDILNTFSYQHRLKINISDANQSFTPLLTGNINWVSAPNEENFWHLFIRFPKTNIVYEWTDLAHTKDLAAMSVQIEETILQQRDKFYDNNQANGDELFELVNTSGFNTQLSASPFSFPPYKLPYYEGLNRYNHQYWLGIYRRDELFSIEFLKEVCTLCISTNSGSLCSTPWKTIIIKGIQEQNRKDWNYLLDKYQINLRHAANELNFQVDDNSEEALHLKQYLVKYLNDDDTRSFGVCIGIKTRTKSEVFSSILVRRKPLIRIGKLGLFYTYDILCAKDYNPNERTDFVYSSGNPKFVLAEQLRRAILSFYAYKNSENTEVEDTYERDMITE